MTEHAPFIKAVLSLIREKPEGMSATELVKSTGLSRGAAQKLLKDLYDSQQLTRVRRDYAYYYFASED